MSEATVNTKGTKSYKKKYKNVVLPKSKEKVEITVTHGQATVLRKAKVCVGHTKDSQPIYQNAKVKGKQILCEIPVQGVLVAVKFADGTQLTGKSICKKPDVFNLTVGKQHALKRLFNADSGINNHSGQVDKSHKRRIRGIDRRFLKFFVMKNGRVKNIDFLNDKKQTAK